jgi:inorganic pyrophosphatase
MSGIVSWRGFGRERTRGWVDNLRSIPTLVIAALTLGPCVRVPRRSVVGGAPVSPRVLVLDEETLVGPKHFARGYPADNDNGSVNAVVEIPCGTTAKFEVTDGDGMMHWQLDRDHGGRREIDYLPFLVNYGMVPRTLADDGDALDIVVLGRGIERGHVAQTRIIGVLKMADGDARDDKLIAVPLEPDLENGFSRLHDLSELDDAYPNVRSLIELWFESYWGVGATEVIGWGDAEEARMILEQAKLRVSWQPRAAADLRPRARLPFAGRGR